MSRIKPYQRHKSALEQHLSEYLASLSPPKCVSSCTLDDVIKFVIGEDKSGRTIVHAQSCSRVVCSCPSRLAAGSVDSLLGKLRAIFNNIGHLHDSNPVAHPRLSFVREEQAARAIVPSQAVPLFFVKFSALIDFLRCSVKDSGRLSVSYKHILVRDAVVFVVDFFAGERASDLDRLLANQVFRLGDRKGFFKKLILTKLLVVVRLLRLFWSLLRSVVFVRFCGLSTI